MGLADSIRRTIQRYPAIKPFLKAVAGPFRPGSNSRYAHVEGDAVNAVSLRLRNAWQDCDIPQRQRLGVERQLAAYRAGRPDVSFDALSRILRPLVAVQESSGKLTTLLEVGCASGYHSEVLAIKGLQVAYSGCDYSPALVEMARRFYPSLDLQVQDATRLEYCDDSFDVVLSGCCLLHIEDFEAAIRETARVTKKYAVFHRTPTLLMDATRYYTKRAYGVDMLEIHFNEEQLVSLFRKHCLMVMAIATLHVDWRRSDALASKSYVCVKMSR